MSDQQHVHTPDIFTRWLLLVRHSMPEIVPEVPAREWRLSVEGRRRCEVLAERLAPHAPVVVLASDEPKARETGELVAARVGVPIEIHTGFREHDRYNVPFLSRGVFEERIAALFDRRDELVLGRETGAQALTRFDDAVRCALAAYPTGALAIVTHGTVLTLYASARAAVAPLPFWRALGLPALITLDVSSGHLRNIMNEIA